MRGRTDGRGQISPPGGRAAAGEAGRGGSARPARRSAPARGQSAGRWRWSRSAVRSAPRARYGAGLLWPTAPGAFPWTTLLVNALGCAVIGVFMVLITDVWSAHRAGAAVLRHRGARRVHHLLDVRRRHRSGWSTAVSRARRSPTWRLTLLAALAAVWAAAWPDPPRRWRGGSDDRLDRTAALRLTVLIGESDLWHHRPLYAEIVHRAHPAGLAGASVFRGVEGFGASSLIHTSRLLSLSEDLPVAVVVVDTEERVRAFLPQLDELVVEGLVIARRLRGRPVRGAGRRRG